jgi:hypothetical protein
MNQENIHAYSHWAVNIANTNSSTSKNTSQIIVFSTADLEAIINKILSCTNSLCTPLIIRQGKSSWNIDPACCNHLTSDGSRFGF